MPVPTGIEPVEVPVAVTSTNEIVLLAGESAWVAASRLPAAS